MQLCHFGLILMIGVILFERISCVEKSSAEQNSDCADFTCFNGRECVVEDGIPRCDCGELYGGEHCEYEHTHLDTELHPKIGLYAAGNATNVKEAKCTDKGQTFSNMTWILMSVGLVLGSITGSGSHFLYMHFKNKKLAKSVAEGKSGVEDGQEMKPTNGSRKRPGISPQNSAIAEM